MSPPNSPESLLSLSSVLFRISCLVASLLVFGVSFTTGFNSDIPGDEPKAEIEPTFEELFSKCFEMDVLGI